MVTLFLEFRSFPVAAPPSRSGKPAAGAAGTVRLSAQRRQQASEADEFFQRQVLALIKRLSVLSWHIMSAYTHRIFVVTFYLQYM